ncbi:response regulator transcription factor [Anaerobium acetethylicum]|uniref:Heme response regulator HssR n=1 Tax=Anaerobium acetethylicum TaxID=1619234 RepID=A0A1D3TNC7_9FIRM|nr:response regulator transcription factor [Anaerobium acetethylicum]SCP94838.1 DNA-binding response regulator, OmpR family, contains REC and winged-helix (wHTH) domain [Anaerobium acetethylicum]
MFRVIVAEDDTEIRQLYAKVLRRNGYDVTEANDGQDALDILDTTQPDLIIADLMMPRIDGYELITSLRNSGYKIPILIITAKDSFMDLEQGFLSGADDYMVKPVNINEMVLRVQALLRRAQMVSERKFIIGQTVFNYDSYSVTDNSKEMSMPQKEFLLLFQLISNCGKAFTRLQLMDEVWGYDSDADPHTVDVHINRLRNRFINNTDFEIVTIRGMGYKAVKR